MRGLGSVRFSELFADTIETHGVLFAFAHYAKTMDEAEFAVWFRGWSGRFWEGCQYYA